MTARARVEYVMEAPAHIMPDILTRGKSPEAWADVLGGQGIEISPRTIRERARRIGAYRIAGRAMVLLPEHIDQIFQEAPCSNRNNAGASGTPMAGSNSTGVQSADIIAKARAHLRSAGAATGSRQKPKGSSVVTLPVKRTPR